MAKLLKNTSLPPSKKEPLPNMNKTFSEGFKTKPKNDKDKPKDVKEKVNCEVM